MRALYRCYGVGDMNRHGQSADPDDSSIFGSDEDDLQPPRFYTWTDLGHDLVVYVAGLCLIAAVIVTAWTDGERDAHDACVAHAKATGKPHTYSYTRKACEADPYIPEQYRFHP